MSVFLLDTNVVSLLFKPDHPLHQTCLEIVRGRQWFILLLWPNLNQWGDVRRRDLEMHIDLCTTLFPDEATCVIWAGIMAESRAVGRSITPSDAWIAAAARQWDLPLVTADFRDFEHLDQLTLIPVP